MVRRMKRLHTPCHCFPFCLEEHCWFYIRAWSRSSYQPLKPKVSLYSKQESSYTQLWYHRLWQFYQLWWPSKSHPQLLVLDSLRSLGVKKYHSFSPNFYTSLLIKERLVNRKSRGNIYSSSTAHGSQWPNIGIYVMDMVSVKNMLNCLLRKNQRTVTKFAIATEALRQFLLW